MPDLIPAWVWFQPQLSSLLRHTAEMPEIPTPNLPLLDACPSTPPQQAEYSMIREATQADVDALALMGARFFLEAGLPSRGVEFDPQSFLMFCEALAKDHILLVAEQDGHVFGMIGVGIVPAYWNCNIRLAQEVFWYVEPERRGRAGRLLLDEMQKRAEEKGAILCAMVAEHGLRGDAVAQLYRRQGFAPAESTFWKRLGAVH